MVLAKLLELWLNHGTDGGVGDGTARMKVATGRGIDRAGYLT